MGGGADFLDFRAISFLPFLARGLEALGAVRWRRCVCERERERKRERD